MNSISKAVSLGMSYEAARHEILAYYAAYMIEHAKARMVAEDVLNGVGTLEELTEAQIGAWGVNVIGQQGAAMFRFAVMFYVLYPEG